MATNNFAEFDTAKADIQTDAEYAADSQRVNGVSTGLARTAFHNKLFRQLSVMVAAIGQVIADLGTSVNDSSVATLVAAFKATILAAANHTLSSETASLYGLSGANAKVDYVLAKMPFTSSFVTFAGNVNPNMLDAALGRHVEEYVNHIGLQLAMYAWFKGDSRTTYPFANLKTKTTLNDILSNAAAVSEMFGNTNIFTLLANSPYFIGKAVYSPTCLKEICSSALASGAFKIGLQPHRETIISTLNASGLFTKTANVTYRTLNAADALCSANLNSNTIIIPTSSPDQCENGAYSASVTSNRSLYSGTDYQIWSNSAVPIDEVRTVTYGVSLRGIYYKQNKVEYEIDPAVICDVYTVI